MSKCFVYKKNFSLVSGSSLSEFTLSYETYGGLNKDKTNCILICPALTGDASVSDGGWWDGVVGSGKAIDTDKYFVLCSAVLGSCKGSTNPCSIDPNTGEPYGINFPLLTIEDMVHAQRKLLSFLDIDSLCFVVGPSMGGMQALFWSILYPDMVKNCIVIASTAKFSPQALAFGTVGRSAITYDPDWRDGSYTTFNTSPKKGLAIARMIGHLTYLSARSIEMKFGRRFQNKKELHYNFSSEFQIESYLSYQGDKFVKTFDANSYLYLSKAMSYFDLDTQFGGLENAFSLTKATFLILSIDTDWLYPSSSSRLMAKQLMRLNREVTYAEVVSDYGHDAFLIEQDKFSELISSFVMARCDV
ncbi:MAG: homoserine O-acetyltransferase [bacterium]